MPAKQAVKVAPEQVNKVAPEQAVPAQSSAVEPPPPVVEPMDGQAEELAAQLRALAAVDPRLANQLVSELVASVDKATGGAFTAQLAPEVRTALGLLDGAVPA